MSSSKGEIDCTTKNLEAVFEFVSLNGTSPGIQDIHELMASVFLVSAFTVGFLLAVISRNAAF